eukprot:6490362-Amphidinium_carterae.1
MLKRGNSKSIVAIEEEMKREKKKQQKKEESLVRLKLDRLLDERVDIVPDVLRYAQKVLDKSVKPMILSDDEENDTAADAETEKALKGKKREKHEVDPDAMLEKWQTTFTRLRSEEICLLLQEMNPITFTPANLASLRNIRGQRVIPKERLLECLELATGISGDEPIVPPFFSDLKSVINYALKKHESLGNRSESLTMPPRDAENRWWIEQGLYWLEVSADFTKLTVTQRFSNETFEIESDGTWGPTTRFMIMHNFSYKQSVLTRDSTVALQRLSAVFDEAGWRRNLAEGEHG